MLIFEEFIEEQKYGSSYHPKYMNFLMFFSEKDQNHLYMKFPIFQRFKEKHPDLEKKLREMITPVLKETNLPNKLDEETEKNLYEAYKIMIDLGATDKDILG